MKKSKTVTVTSGKPRELSSDTNKDETPVFRRSIKCSSLYAQSPEKVYEEWEKLVKKHKWWQELTSEECNQLSRLVSGINVFESHRFLINIPSWKREIDQTSIVEFAEDLIREYNCETTLEKSLCEVISASFYSYMRGTEQLQVIYQMEYLSNEKNGFYSMISKR